MRLLVPTCAISSVCVARLRSRGAAALSYFARGEWRPGGSERTRRVIIVASVFVGCALAALVLFIGGRAVVDALLYDGASDDAVVAVDGASDGVSAQRCVARMAEQGTISTGGYVYSIEADDDACVFAYRYDEHGADPFPLFEVSGTPLGFAYFDGVVLHRFE